MEELKFIGSLGKPKDYKAKVWDGEVFRNVELVWGDHVLPRPIIHDEAHPGPGYVPKRVRASNGFVHESHLLGVGLLEIYTIDVGQGDGILMRTPDDKWHLIDAGVSNARQNMIKKGAANFLRWKFIYELQKDSVVLANVIVTHPDFDHFGGLLDLLGGELTQFKAGDRRYNPDEKL